MKLKMMGFEMNEKYLEYTLVPAGLLVMGIYHFWLLLTINRNPRLTVIGLNRVSRYRWVYHMMSDPQKNGILAVQTIRNNLMASTLLATISITLSSLISALVSSSPKPEEGSFIGYTIHQVKYFSVLVCFLAAFFCNMQCTRYYAHVSFLVNVPCPECRDGYIEFVAKKMHRAGLFWSLGLRAFYFSFPLLIWIFGPIAMFTCSCFMAVMLYYLDFSRSSKYLPYGFEEKHTNNHDVESIVPAAPSEDTDLYSSLLRSMSRSSAT